MICSKCEKIINPISGKNYGTTDHPTCEKCFSIQKIKNEEASISKSKPACRNHPKIDAEFICQVCDAPICKTCAFEFRDCIHICPGCIDKPQSLSAKQKKYLIWSYAMSVVASVEFFIIIFIGAMFQKEISNKQEISIFILYLISILTGITSVIGISKAISAMFYHRKNPLSIWIALIWNSIPLGFLLLAQLWAILIL